MNGDPFFNLISRISTLDLNEIKVFSGRCINNKIFPNKKCNVCVEACVVNSIKNDAIISIDWSSCIKCGLCAGVCPTEVFKIQKPSDTNILNIILEFREKDVINLDCNFVNGRFADIQRDTNSHKKKIVVSCIARFSEIELLLLMIIGRNKIKFDFCHNECKFEYGHKIVDYKLRKASELFNLLDVNKELELNLRKELRISKRRELILSAFDASIKSILQASEVNKDESKKNIFLPNRSILIKIIELLKIPSKEINKVNHLFGEIIINKENCTLEGECASVCPTEALGFISNNKGKELNIINGYCVGCRLCVEKCCNNSLELNKVNLSKLSASKKIIIESEYRLCESCGNQFFSKIKEELICPSCVTRWANIDNYF